MSRVAKFGANESNTTTSNVGPLKWYRILIYIYLSIYLFMNHPIYTYSSDNIIIIIIII